MFNIACADAATLKWQPVQAAEVGGSKTGVATVEPGRHESPPSGGALLQVRTSLREGNRPAGSGNEDAVAVWHFWQWLSGDGYSAVA